MSNKNCNHKVPCGCGDSSLTTPPPCNSLGDCLGELCQESVGQKCVVYDNHSFTYDVNGTEFNVNQGDRLDEIIQKILIYLNDPTCINTAPFGMYATLVLKDSITLVWEGSDIIGYNVTYTDGIAPITVSTLTKSITISALVPDTEYSITVVGQSTPLCPSVTIKIKTKIA